MLQGQTRFFFLKKNEEKTLFFPYPINKQISNSPCIQYYISCIVFFLCWMRCFLEHGFNHVVLSNIFRHCIFVAGGELVEWSLHFIWLYHWALWRVQGRNHRRRLYGGQWSPQPERNNACWGNCLDVTASFGGYKKF